MRRVSRYAGRIAANVVLLLVLAGLLVAYATATSELPVRLYTPLQQEYLAYNSTLSISQAAPTFCMRLPILEVTETIQRARKIGSAKGLQAETSGACPSAIPNDDSGDLPRTFVSNSAGIVFHP